MMDLDDALKFANPPEPKDALDEAILSVKAKGRSDLAAAQIETQGQQPDKLAEAMKVGKRLDVPSMVVADHIDEFRQQEERERIEKAAGTSPLLAQWLRSPENMGVAKDDAENLSGIESSLATAKYIARQFPAAIAGDLPSGTFRLAAIPFDLAAMTPEVNPIAAAWAQGLHTLADGAEFLGKRIAGEHPEDTGMITSGVASGVRSVGMNLPYLAASVLSGNPLPMILGMSGTVAGLEYQKGREEGLTVPQAASFGLIHGAFEYVTEKRPAVRLIGDLKAGSPFMKVLANNLAREIPQEQIATLTQDFTDWAYLKPESPIMDYVRERPSAAAETLIATVVASGLQTSIAHGTQKLMERDYKADRAKASGDSLIRLDQIANDSKLRERSSEKFEELLGQQLKSQGIESVWMPVAEFETFYQSQNVNPAEAWQEMGGEQAEFERAQAAGSDLQIPYAKYLSRLSAEERQNLTPHLRMDVEAMTAAEAQRMDEERESIISEAMEGQTQTDDSAYDFIYNDLLGQLMARFPRNVAETYAEAEATRFVAFSRTMGVDPIVDYRANAPRLVFELPQALRKIYFDSELDPLIDAVRKGDVQKQMGPSLLQFLRSKGGVQDQGGELSVMDAGQILGKPGERRLVNPDGMPLDEALEAAIEAGYFHAQDFVTAGTDVLLDAMRREIAGESVYSDKLADPTVRDRVQAIEELDMMLGQMDIPVTASNEEIKAALKGVALNGLPMVTAEQTVLEQPDLPLAVLHRLTEDNLIFADRIGGLAMPSLAVLPAGQEFKGYGEITLIGKPELGDPSKTPVFDADIYSPTFPMPEYSKVSSKKVQPVTQEFRKIAGEFEDSGFIETFWEHSTNRPDPQRIVSDMLRSLAAQAAFLRENGVKVEAVRRQKSLEAPFVEMPSFQAFEQKMGGRLTDLSPRHDPETWIEYSQAVSSAIDEYVEKQERADPMLREHLRESYRDNYLDEDGKLLFGRTIRIDRSRQNIGKDEVDSIETRDLLETALKGREAEFKSWVDSKVLPLFGEPFLHIGRKKVPYTLQFIVEKMSGELKGAEKTITFGPGKARAVSAKQFQDVETMRDAAKQIRPEGEVNAAREEANKLLESYRNEVVEYYGEPQDGPRSSEFGRVWEGLDASMRALSRWATARKRNKDAFRKALLKEGFQEVPDHVLESAVEAGAAFLRAPVPYFEAKPQRAVSLSEFPGAVIPDNATEKAQEVLEMAGIEVEIYPSGDESARLESLSRLVDRLKKKNINVLFQEGARGQIRFTKRGVAPRQFEIAFTKPDLSTFLHEMGHYWLERLGDAAEQPDAPKQIRDDYAAILNHLGVKSRDEVGDKQHKEFARMSEAYLMEGKAPSAKLREIFARFRSWLLHVYKRVRALNVRMTPEIRQVFDRMYATQQEIEEAGKIIGSTPLWGNAKDAGMTDAQWMAYLDNFAQARRQAEDDLAADVMEPILREEKKWWNDERKKVAVEVSEVVNQRKDVIALSVLRTGKTPDGVEMPGLKISKKSLVDDFGFTPETLARLPKGIYAVDGGQSPGALANMFGYANGRELVEALAKLPDRNQLIKELTDDEMRRRFPDVLMDGSIAERAMRALHNDKSGELLVREAQVLGGMIAKATGKKVFVLSQQMAKSAAKQAIAEMKVKDLVPNRWKQAEARFGNQAYKLARQGNLEEAASAKRRQLLNHHLYREASQQLEQSNKHRDRIISFDKKSRQEVLGKAGGDYLEQMQQLLAQYEFKKLPLKALRRRMALREWIDSKSKEIDPVGKADYYEKDEMLVHDVEDLSDSSKMNFDKLKAEAETVNWRELTVEELAGVRDTADFIWHLAKMKDGLLKQQAFKRLSEAAESLSRSITENANRVVPQALEPNLPKERIKDKYHEFFVMHRRLSSIAYEMDGGKDAGTAWQLLVRPLNEATETETTLLREHQKKILELAKTHLAPAETRSWYSDQQEFSVGELTRQGRLAVALNWGNEGNRSRLMEGRGWTEGQVHEVLDSLSQSEWNYVQAVWDYLETLRPMAEANHKSLFAVAPKWVEASPVITKFGVLKGGYYPIKFDTAVSVSAMKNALEASKDSIAGSGDPSRRQMLGSMKERVKGTVRMPIRLSVTDVLTEHVADLVHHVAFDQTLLDIGRLLKRPEVQDAIVRHYGIQTYRNIWGLMVEVKNGPIPARGLGEKFIVHVRNGATISGLGWKFFTSALQVLGLTNSVVRTGGTWVLRGVLKQSGNAVMLQNSAKTILKKSQMMANRRLNQNREIADIRRKFGEKKIPGWVEDSFFWMITNSQFYLVDVPTWIGAYDKAKASGLDEETSIAVADQNVIDAQGGGAIKDLVPIQRGGPLKKLFTNFMSYMVTTWNLVAARYRVTSFKKPSDVAKLGMDILTLYGANVLLHMLLEELTRGHDEDDKEKNFMVRLVQEQAAFFVAQFFLVRELSGVIQGWDYRGPAGLSFFFSAGQLAKQSVQAVEEGETDEAFWRALNRTAGPMFHYPAGQVDMTIRGINALAEGETDDPRVLFFGPRKDE